MTYRLPELTKHQENTIREMYLELGVSYPSILKYVKGGMFPAEVCLKIQEESDSDITAQFLRPDLFKPTKEHHKLANLCVNYFEQYEKNNEIIIGILNVLEVHQPALYEQTIDQIKPLNGGNYFIAQRLAHKNDEKI